VRTFCVITCGANELVADIHDRMPVIIPSESYVHWLSTLDPDPHGLLLPFPAAAMKMWPIGMRVNKPANDDEGILEPVEVQEGPPLL
jgi:putative SOS response-associated peptidase YedK